MNNYVVIGLPTMGSVDVKTCESLIKMKRGDCKVFPLSTEYSLIYEARDNIIKRALENPHTSHILFIDSDIVFGADALESLIDDDVDVVTGVYRKKEDECKIVGCNTENNPLEMDDLWDNVSTFEIGRCGMGFCLIKRKVVEDVLEAFNTCFHPFDKMGEDYSFCERAKSLGFKIWMNPFVRCNHIGKKVYEV